jgi:hypothetical protein
MPHTHAAPSADTSKPGQSPALHLASTSVHCQLFTVIFQVSVSCLRVLWGTVGHQRTSGDGDGDGDGHLV